MTIPRENALAFFPQPVAAGNLMLGPLTLAGAVRLGELGIDIGKRIPEDKLFQVAHVLAIVECKVENGKWRMSWRPPFFIFHSPFSIFVRHARVGLKELSNAVNKVLNDAFATYVKPISEKKKTISLCPEGLGIPLEYAEFLCAEYGWSWETAINTPLATVYALYAAYWRRHGGRLGIDYMNKTAKPIEL